LLDENENEEEEREMSHRINRVSEEDMRNRSFIRSERRESKL